MYSAVQFLGMSTVFFLLLYGYFVIYYPLGRQAMYSLQTFCRTHNCHYNMSLWWLFLTCFHSVPCAPLYISHALRISDLVESAMLCMVSYLYPAHLEYFHRHNVSSDGIKTNLIFMKFCHIGLYLASSKASGYVFWPRFSAFCLVKVNI